MPLEDDMNTGSSFAWFERDAGPPYTIFPNDFVAYVLCKLLADGKETFTKSDVAKYIPVFDRVEAPDRQPMFSLHALSCRRIGDEYVSNEVSNIYRHLRNTGCAVLYNPMTLNEKGKKYCQQLVRRFYSNHPKTARELERVLGTSRAELLDE